MKVVVIKDGVTFENGILPVGSDLDLPDTMAERLVKCGCAEAVEPTADPEVPDPEVPDPEVPDPEQKKAPAKRTTKKAE